MSQIDPELLAKFIDGRATPEERRVVMERADADPEVLAILADSAALAEARSAAPTWRRALPSRRTAPVWLALAAVLVAVVVLPRTIGTGGVPVFNAALLDGQSIVAGAVTGASIGTVRGESTVLRAQRSVRLGARVADFEALARAGDSATVVVLAELAAAAREIPGGAVAATMLEGLGRASDPATRGAAIDALGSLLDRERFRAGTWIEVIRLAATANAATILRSGESLGAIRRVAAMRDISVDAKSAATRLVDALASQDVSAPTVAQAAADLLSALSR